jgi:hypothetical protein
VVPKTNFAAILFAATTMTGCMTGRPPVDASMIVERVQDGSVILRASINPPDARVEEPFRLWAEYNGQAVVMKPAQVSFFRPFYERWSAFFSGHMPRQYWHGTIERDELESGVDQLTFELRRDTRVLSGGNVRLPVPAIITNPKSTWSAGDRPEFVSDLPDGDWSRRTDGSHEGGRPGAFTEYDLSKMPISCELSVVDKATGVLLITSYEFKR